MGLTTATPPSTLAGQFQIRSDGVACKWKISTFPNPQVSLCLKVNVDYDRYSSQVGLFEISRYSETQRPVAALCK